MDNKKVAEEQARAEEAKVRRAPFTKWAETYYRNSEVYTAYDFELGFAGWEAGRADLLDENDRLREALGKKISSETLLTEFNLNRGGLNMQFEGGACQFLAEVFAEQFRNMGAENYVEIGFTAVSDNMPLLVTIQRVGGKTPGFLKNEADMKVAALEQKLLQYEADQDSGRGK